MKYKILLLLVLFLSVSFVSAQATIDEAKKYLPDFKAINLGTIIVIFFGVIILLVVLGIGLYFMIRWLKFNKTIVILEDVSGSDNLEPVGRDKAMVVKVGKGGSELLYLRKRKVYRGSYGKRMGKNMYYFAIGKDGYWYNITLGDLDPALQKVGVKTTSVNMRYQNESLQELIKERFDKPTFWGQYGQIILNLAFFMVVAVMFWLYFSAFKETAPALTQSAEALKEASDTLRQVVGGLDGLRASGGIIPK